MKIDEDESIEPALIVPFQQVISYVSLLRAVQVAAISHTLSTLIPSLQLSWRSGHHADIPIDYWAGGSYESCNHLQDNL